MRAQRIPILGVLIALAITTTMDAIGLSDFSALPLLPLMLLFWWFERLPRRSVGFTWGRPRHYALAVLHPTVVLGLLTLISAAAGAIDLSQTNWTKAWLNVALVSVSTIIVAIGTEEGFFRGWLWASLQRSGVTSGQVLIWSSLAFSLWHVSAVTLETGFDLPGPQIPVFLVNAAVMGAIWGLWRQLSGSVIVASVSHGLWNGLAYVLFGVETRTGALGITDTAVYGPEAGIVGLGLNVLFLAVLWWWCRQRIGNAAELRVSNGRSADTGSP
jgi:membrane protease YdiL (CAAX protease family)